MGIEQKDRQEVIYESLLKKGVIITEKESREQISNWHKTALISFEGNGNFIIKFTQESISKFFDEIRHEPEYLEYTLSKTHYLKTASLFENQILFYAFKEERKLPNMIDALDALKVAPFLTQTTSSIQARLR